MSKDSKEYGFQLGVTAEWDLDTSIVKDELEFSFLALKTRIFPEWQGEPKYEMANPDIFIFGDGTWMMAFGGKAANGRRVWWKALVPNEFILNEPRSDYFIAKMSYERSNSGSEFPVTQKEFDSAMKGEPSE